LLQRSKEGDSVAAIAFFFCFLIALRFFCYATVQ
jgi:hypothetical protein